MRRWSMRCWRTSRVGGTKDALPLLAFTLERLYTDYGADGDLQLGEYEKLGPNPRRH